MRENIIRIEPFEILNLLNFTAKQEINEHGYVKFSAIIDEKFEEEYTMYAINKTWAKVMVIDCEGKEEVFFYGIIADLYIDSKEGLKKLYVTIKTGTSLMDVSIHTRTYQRSSILYTEVFSSFTNNYYKGGFIANIPKGATIDNLIVQYRETDWQFTKRMASHFNTVILPEYQTEGVRYYVGLNDSEAKIVLNTQNYAVRSDSDEYEYKKDYNLDVSEIDCLHYTLKTREIYLLGDKIILNDRKLNIYRIDTEYIGGECIHTYYLKTGRGFAVNKKYNLQGIGLGFYSRIVDVKKDVVMIAVDEDENAGACGVRWFPYSTVYSTPDGTGWYCMPEIGDNVRLYLPTVDEAEGYVISSTHLQVDNSQNTHNSANERSNPDFKSIMNKQGKEVLFTPDSIIITNNNGMSIEIIDEVGIKIISDKKITIQAENEIFITSKKSFITAIAESYIDMTQGKQNTRIEDNIAHAGAKVHLD